MRGCLSWAMASQLMVFGFWAMATSSTTGRLAAFPPLLISQNPRSHPARLLRFNRVVRSLHEEKEAAATNGVDFDGKLPLFGAQFLSLYLPTAFRSEISSPWVLIWIFSSSICELFNYSMEDLEMRLAFCCFSPRGWFAAPSVFRRRFILGTATGTVIALGADFLGSTSAVLSLNPEFFRGIRADVLYPIRGYKRCYETSRGFGAPQFLLPCLAFSTSRLIGYVYLCFQFAPRFSSLWLLWRIFSLVLC
jgi:hypothetical protein